MDQRLQFSNPESKRFLIILEYKPKNSSLAFIIFLLPNKVRISSAKLSSSVFRHDNPQNQINNRSGKSRTDCGQHIKNADQSYIPTEIFCNAAAHTGYHAVI